MISGGPIWNLKKGWALLPFVGKRAHYWIEDTTTMVPNISEVGRTRYYNSLCGVVGVVNHKVPALDHGSWPRCARCSSANNKLINLGLRI